MESKDAQVAALTQSNEALEAEVRRLTKVVVKDHERAEEQRKEQAAQQESLAKKGLEMDEKWARARRLALKQRAETTPALLYDTAHEEQLLRGVEAAEDERAKQLLQIKAIQALLHKLVASSSTDRDVQTDEALGYDKVANLPRPGSGGSRSRASHSPDTADEHDDEHAARSDTSSVLAKREEDRLNKRLDEMKEARGIQVEEDSVLDPPGRSKRQGKSQATEPYGSPRKNGETVDVGVQAEPDQESEVASGPVPFDLVASPQTFFNKTLR